MKHEGQIKVHSENMLPIIKKWLYSDKDIFIRELVANCCDAIKKLEKLISLGDANINNYSPAIDIFLDTENHTLSFSDNGIGMTADEVEKYITQIAFSGAEDFLKKYKDSHTSNTGIIGHFGLGFYSAFMVSSLVEIETLSYKPGSTPVHWESDGNNTYTIEDGERATPGTTIILHINDNEINFLSKENISKILKKYCSFMPYKIYFETSDDVKQQLSTEASDENMENSSNTPINNPTPLWLKSPKDCTKEEYETFYQETFQDFNKPLFWIHINVDYPFNVKGILYFPKQKNSLELSPGKVKLFSNQVYIADNIPEVIPEFLMLLNGVIDCSDLPLNVSRSSLQNDGNISKISKHITKKVSDKLHSEFNNNRKQFEAYWDDIAPFIKFGCIKDESFYEKIKDILLVKTINDEYCTLDKYSSENNNTIFYVSDKDVQSQYIRMFKENNTNAIILNEVIDNHFISFLEYKNNLLKFKRIDSDISNNIKDDTSAENSDVIIEKFKSAINIDNIIIKAESLKANQVPAVMLLSEDERRIYEMAQLYGDLFAGQKPNAITTIILNTENEIIKSIPTLSDELCNLVCKNVYSLALISHKSLSSDELSEFTANNVQLLSEIIKK